MELYFAGAEVPTWRKLLTEEHVPHVAVNFLHLRPRLPQGRWLLADHFPDEQKIFLISGSAGTSKKEWTLAQHEEFFEAYFDFIRANLDRLAYFTEYDPLDLGLEWVLRQRQIWDGQDKVVPVWHEEWGAPLLRSMVEAHPNLGVPPISQRTQNVLSGLVRRTRINLHGLSFSHPYDAPGGLYRTIVSSSWISPTRWGETVIWDQNRLRRYPSDEKIRVRTRHRQHFIQAGFDAEKILDDNSREIARYTVWAWRQMEAAMAGREPIRLTRKGAGLTNGSTKRDPDSAPVPVDVVGHTPALLHENVRPIPVFDFHPVTSTIQNPDGPGTVEVTSRVATMTTAGLRKCDSCSLAVVCPLFEPGADCRYSIPVEIRNRDQLLGVLHSLLEMQAQRVAFGFMSEQLQGGYPDANLSAELDRMMRMTQSVKDIQDNRDFLKVTVEGRAQAGVLSRLFGAERAETLRRVDPDRAEDAVRRTMG